MTTLPWYRAFGDSLATYYRAHTDAVPVGEQQDIGFLIDRDLVGQRVIDVGCGVGRHAVALATRGCAVTGADCSRGLLDVGMLLASQAGIRVVDAPPTTGTIRFLEIDARREPLPRGHDLALSLDHGAFGLGDSVAEDLAVLRAIRAALRDGGRLVLTVTSAVGMIAQSAFGMAGSTHGLNTAAPFDATTLEVRSDMAVDPWGGVLNVPAVFRAYTAPHLTALCMQAGLAVENVYGATSGEWKAEPLTWQHPDIMVIARAADRRGTV